MTDSGKAWRAGGPLARGYLTLFILVFGLGAWSVMTTISGAIIATGRIEVTQSRQVVQHPDGGVVAEILVMEGEAVKAGQALLRLDGGQIRSDLAIVSIQMFELGARRARLEAERDDADVVVFPPDLLAAAASDTEVAEVVEGQRGLFAAHRKTNHQAIEQRRTRIEQIRSQIAGLNAEDEALERQIQIVGTDLATQTELLTVGLVESARISALEREAAQLAGRKGEVEANRAEAESRITEIEIEIASLTTIVREEAESELRDVIAQENELAERISALNEEIARLDIRAPTAGIVLGLITTTPQSVIKPAENLMFIVPQDRPLFVAADIPVSHVDEIAVGREVRLVFSSIPSQAMPELRGTVTLVSADALTEERSGLSFYRAEIAIDTEYLEKLHGVSIVPGMPVEAYIKTEDRTPLAFLLKPFTDYFRRAFRET